MERKELYHLIDLQPEIIQELEAAGSQINLTEIDVYLRQLTDIKTAAQAYQSLTTLLQDDPGQLKMLYCQMECARRVYEQYQETHIPDRYFVDTMKCFRRFIEECKAKNGRYYFDRGWWTYRQLSMTLFRVGTLEYEFCTHEGEPVIGIHIPSDADLSKESVDDSLKQAEEFFQTYFSDYTYNKYTCDSWLLSPALLPLLSEKSNIRSFQQRFHILRKDEKDREYIEWVFQVTADTAYENLPEKTSLQRKIKKLMLEGGGVGAAYGIMDIRKFENDVAAGTIQCQF